MSINISILGLLGVLFVGLKLTHIIDWSWWVVLLPFYGAILFGFVLIIFAAAISALAGK